MVLDGIMKDIKKFCKNDDSCIFIILVLLGFLLCMLFNRDEGFLNYSFVADPKSQGNSEDLHQYGPADGEDKFGKPPTNDPKEPSQVEKPIGMVAQYPGPPSNGYMGINKEVELAKQGKQYQMKVLPNKEKLNRTESALMGEPNNKNTPGPIGVELGYQSYMQWASFGGPSSDMGPDKPMGQRSWNQGEKVEVKAATGVPEQNSTNVGGTEGKPEMLLVLFYAPWCGHSKNMLGGYDNVISKLNGTDMNGVKVTILKIDMDTEEGKKEAKKYNVDIKGFPTLYTFVKSNGNFVGQPFNPRDEAAIIDELQKRTKSLN